MGGILFLYVGAEFGLGSWVSTYAHASAHAGIFAAALLTSGFWLALGLGRVLTGVYFRHSRDSLALLIASAAGAGIATLALSLTSGNLGISAVCAFGAGLFMGPMWPTTIAIASEAGLSHDTAAAVTMGTPAASRSRGCRARSRRCRPGGRRRRDGGAVRADVRRCVGVPAAAPRA